MATLEIKYNKDGKIFAPLKNKYLIATPEEKVRQEFICTLVNKYGYSLEQMAQELKVNKSQRGTGKASADIVIWKSKEDKRSGKKAFIVVELKADNIKIRQEDYYQGANYASWASATFFVTSNLKETRFFKLNKEYLPTNLEEIVGIPFAKDINNTKKINELLTQTKAFTRDEFTKVLQACHNIIRDNDKLGPAESFDEISKILFIKIHYERTDKSNTIFTKHAYMEMKKAYELANKLKMDTIPYMQDLFNDTKNAFKDDFLFRENEKIEIKENSFISIVHKLERYNLSDTQDDVKGIAFEHFLGKTFRGELGQFFTPRTLVDFMVGVIDPKENEVICDCTCGSGGFLIKAFEYIRESIEEDIRVQKKKIIDDIYEKSDYDNLDEEKKIEVNHKISEVTEKFNQDLDTTREDSRLNNLSCNCIYGVDANPRMARTSKMNMIMHGDGHGGIHHHEGLLNVNGIFEERFDCILTNPPFGSSVDKTQLISDEEIFKDESLIAKYLAKYGDRYEEAQRRVTDNVGSPVISLYEVGKLSTLTEVVFIDRCLSLLKKGGRLGIVLPDGVLNNQNLKKVREYFEGKAKIVFVCSVPQEVFGSSKATVKTSLMFMKKFSEDEEKEYEKACKKADNEARKIFEDEIEELNILIKKIKEKSKKEKTKEDVDNLKQFNKRLSEIEKDIVEKAKSFIKEYFDYQIAFAKVDKAGINNTGGECENELIPVLAEFKEYEIKNHLWDRKKIRYNYSLAEDNRLERSILGD